MGTPAATIPRLTGHGFRVGMVNGLLEAGFPHEYVRYYGRWESESAFLHYLRKEFHEIPQPAPGHEPDRRAPLKAFQEKNAFVVGPETT